MRFLKQEIHGVKGEQICAKKSCTLCTDEKSAGFSCCFIEVLFKMCWTFSRKSAVISNRVFPAYES